MTDTASEVSVYKPTNELRQYLGEPALVGSEKPEVYDKFLSLIASAIKPTDPIGWLLTKNVTDWSWEMRREQAVKADMIKHYQKEVVAEVIKTLAPAGQLKGAMYRIFESGDALTKWATDPNARIEIDAALEARGHGASAILVRAYMRGAGHIDAIDRRIASYERRRNTALREAGMWNESLRRKLEHATTAIIEGEFTDVAEKH